MMNNTTNTSNKIAQIIDSIEHSSVLDELKTQTGLRRVAIFAHAGVLVCAGLYGGLFDAEHAWDNLVDFGGIERIEI